MSDKRDYKMEVFEFDRGWSRLRARITKGGSVYVDLPSRYGQRNSIFRESITLEERGWRFTSTQDDCIEYIFHMWLRDDGMMSWANDLTPGIEYMREPFNPNYPNAGYLNDTAILLYDVSQKVRAYQKRNLPVADMVDLRRLYLTTTLKALGYDSIDAVENAPDISRGYLGLNRVVDSLEKYVDLSGVAHSLGMYGDYEQFKTAVTENVTREEILEYAKPVKDQIEDLVAFMQEAENAIKEKRNVYPGYRLNMREKEGESTCDTYEEYVKKVAILLLEINSDLLTEEQRQKFGIEPFKVVDPIDIEDKISSVIDNEDFNRACEIEDQFAFEETSELLEKLKSLKPKVVVPEVVEPSLTQEEIDRLLSSEASEFEERSKSIGLQDTIHKKYYSKTRKKDDVKKLDDEIVY